MKKFVYSLIPALGFLSGCSSNVDTSTGPAPVAQVVTERYRFFSPSKQESSRKPLLIMIHGCDQNAEDFERSTEMNKFAEQKGFFVLYPNQLKGRNAANCWGWFDPKNRRREGGELAEIVGMVERVSKESMIDQKQIFVAGLSSGAATAAALAACYPDLIQGAAFHSGPALNVADNEWAAMAAMRFGPNPWLDYWATETCRPEPSSKRFVILQGDRDPVVNPAHAEKLLQQFSNLASSNQQKFVVDLIQRGDEKTSIQRRGDTYFVQISGMKHAWAGGVGEKYVDAKALSASELIARFLIEGEPIFTPIE